MKIQSNFTRKIFLFLINRKHYFSLSLFTYFASLLPVKNKYKLTTYLSPTGRLFGVNGLLKSHKLFFRDQAHLPYSPFQLNYYLASNPDLTALDGIEAWEHFILNGIFEGRSPHPFISSQLLSANSGIHEFGRALHSFCFDQSQWFTESTPTVNVIGFSKQYDLKKNINPTFQLFANLPENLKWINRRLNTISATSDEFSNSLKFAITNVLVNSISLGGLTPKIEIATNPISRESIHSSTCWTLSPGRFIAASNEYFQLGAEKVANSAAATSLFVGDALVYSSSEREVHADVLLVIQAFIDVTSFLSLINSQDTFVLSPRDKQSETAFKRYLSDFSIRNVQVLEHSKTFKVTTKRPPIFWDTNSDYIGRALTSNVIPEFHHELNGVNLVNFDEWDTSRSGHASNNDKNIDVIIVDFSHPDFWLKHVSNYQFILTEESNFQSCLLSIPLFQESLEAH